MRFDDLFKSEPDPPSAAPVVSMRPAHSEISAYANAALVRELDKLRATGEGSRNEQLNKAAFSLGQLVAGGELPAHDVADLLAEAARDIGLDPREIMNTLRSGMGDGQKLPRTAPPPKVSNARLEDSNINTETGEVTLPEQTEIDRRQLQIESLYVTHEGLAHIRPPEPLIENWLYQNSLAWLAGKPGDGKSFIALDMAYSVATGQEWQGCRTYQGTVLYIAAEGASGLSIRANAWMEAHPLASNPRIFYLPIGLRLARPDEIDLQALNQALKTLQPVLVIIDTQARVTVGAEENSAKDMGWFIDALETLRAATPATYLTVHHTPRNGENLRGSISLEGGAETVLLSVKDGDVVTLKCTKQKNAAEPGDLQMAMSPIGDSVILSSEAVELVEKMSKIMEELLRALVEGFRREVSATELRDYVKIKEGGSFNRPITDLVNLGFVATRKEGRSRLYEATPKGHLQCLRMSPTSPGGQGTHSSTPPPPFTGGGVGGIPTPGATEPSSTSGPKATRSQVDRDKPCPVCGQPFEDPSDNEECSDQHYEE